MPDDRLSGHESSPGTEPFVPDFDTGPQLGSRTEPFSLEFDTGPQEPLAADPASDADVGEESLLVQTPAPVQSVTVPGRYYYLKWWKLAVVFLGVWIVAAPIGLGLFLWWYHSFDKTPAIFVVLLYVVACIVGGVTLVLIEGKPLLSALALGVMSAPCASVLAAAPLYGYYYCSWAGRCLFGIVPLA